MLQSENKNVGNRCHRVLNPTNVSIIFRIGVNFSSDFELSAPQTPHLRQIGSLVTVNFRGGNFYGI